MKLIFPLWGAKHGSNESLSNETARCRRASCLAGQAGALESSCIRLSPPQPPTGQHGAVLGTWGRHGAAPGAQGWHSMAGTQAWRVGMAWHRGTGMRSWHGTALCSTASRAAGARLKTPSLFVRLQPQEPRPFAHLQDVPAPCPPCPHRVSTSCGARRPNPATYTKGPPQCPASPPTHS